MKNIIKILLTLCLVYLYTDASLAQSKSIKNGITHLPPIVKVATTRGSEYIVKNVSSSLGAENKITTLEKPVVSNNSKDVVSTVKNQDGSSTRTTRRITNTTVVTPKVTTITAPKTVVDKVYFDVITTSIVTTRTAKIVNGKQVITMHKPVTKVAKKKTFVRDILTTSIVQVSIIRENITSVTDNTPGVLIATDTIPAPTLVTNNSTNSTNGTPTSGYNSNPTFYHTQEFTNSPAGSLVNADKAYARGWTGKGVTVAVADTGYSLKSTDLKGQVIATKDYTGQGINDTHGHGTFVLGEIVASKNNIGTHGIAYDSKAIVVKVGTNTRVDLSNAALGLAWASDNGAVVGNVSANSSYDTIFAKNLVNIGNGIYRSTDSRYNYSIGKFYNEMDPLEWKAVTDRGMVVVNSAGNQGLAVSANPGHFATATDSSGNLLLGGRMLIVGAADERGNPYRWSNKAGSVCQNYIAANNSCEDKYKVSDFYLLAPGVNKSTGLNDNVSTMYGTSMAAPIVTGGVAIVSQMWPYMKGENIVKLLTTTANKNLPNYNPATHGQGMLDLDRATQPVGALGIPTSGRTTSAVNTATLTSSGGSGNALSSLKNIGALSNVMIVDEFSRDFYIDLSQGIAVKDKRKISDVKAQQDGLTYLPFQQTFGNYQQGSDFVIFDDLKVGITSNADLSGDWSSAVTKKFGISPNFSVRTTLGTMSEQTTWLGNESSGALSVGKNNNTNFTQLGLDFKQDKNKFSIDLGRGYTNVNTAENSLIKKVDTIHSQSFKIGFEQSIADNSNWGITAGMPNYIIKGSATVSVPYATSAEGDVLYKDIGANLKTTTPEKNLGLYYSQRGESDMDWNMKYNAEYRMDVAGQTNKNSLGFGVQIERRF